jgi:hypothetical protein
MTMGTLKDYLGQGTLSALPPGFYVATDGNDGLSPTADGSGHGPFASLTAACDAMRASKTIKTAYIRAGRYSPPADPVQRAYCGNFGPSALSLTTADSGEIWSHYPPDGVDSADFTGGATSATTGLGALVCIWGPARNITINGLLLHHFAQVGLGAIAINGIAFINNIVHDIFFTRPRGRAVITMERSSTGFSRLIQQLCL